MKWRKRGKLESKIHYMVSICNQDDYDRLFTYLKKTYNIELVKGYDKFSYWIMFSLPSKDDIVDKKFNSIIRREKDILEV